MTTPYGEGGAFTPYEAVVGSGDSDGDPLPGSVDDAG